MSEAGAASVFGLAVGALAMALALGLAGTVQLLSARSAAQTAADAAALAAAPVTFRNFGSDGDPRAEAHRFARENGAELVSCRCAVDRSYRDRSVAVEVVVQVEVLGLRSVDVVARSAAEFRPIVLLDP